MYGLRHEAAFGGGPGQAVVGRHDLRTGMQAARGRRFGAAMGTATVEGQATVVRPHFGATQTPPLNQFKFSVNQFRFQVFIFALQPLDAFSTSFGVTSGTSSRFATPAASFLVVQGVVAVHDAGVHVAGHVFSAGVVNPRRPLSPQPLEIAVQRRTSGQRVQVVAESAGRRFFGAQSAAVVNGQRIQRIRVEIGTLEITQRPATIS